MPVNSPTDPRPLGRPARIDRTRIVAAAIDLGLDTFSLDDIAAALEVTTPALYRHVDGRDDIVRAAAAVVIVDLEPELGAITEWDQWLRAWALGIRGQLGTVGEEVLEAVRTNVGEDSLRVADHGLRLLVDAGLNGAEAGYALWLTVRVACTAGPPDQPTVSGPAAMAEAIDSVVHAGTDDSWQFDLDVVIAGLRARLS